MAKLTLKEWYAIISDLRSKYPEWDSYDDRMRKSLANKNGYPYYTKENTPSGIFQKKFYGPAEKVDAQNIHWQNEMRKEYRTFEVLNVTDNPYMKGFFDTEFELTVTYSL